MNEETKFGLETGIVQFNDRAFFEAHDTLEDVWMEVRGQDRLFYQGLIQLCIGYYHLSCDNLTGSKHLLIRGVDKLSAYPEAHLGICLNPLLAQVRKTIAGIEQTRSGTGMAFWTYPRIETVEASGEIDSNVRGG